MYTARVIPTSYGAYKGIRGAVVFRYKGTNDTFTLAFEDPLTDYAKTNWKGHIEQGDIVDIALSFLKDN